MTKKPEADTGALKHNPFAALSKLKSGSSGRPAAPPVPVRHSTRSVRCHLETKGRSGKVVTRITGLPPLNAEAIAARLRRALGCSATVEGKDVLLTGSLAERASQWLEGAGDLGAIQEERPAARAPAAEALPLADVTRRGPDAAATQRSRIRRGQRVAVVLKPDQESGRLTEGMVSEILTSSSNHPRGIKVRLDSGQVGRVQIVYE